MEKDFDIEMSGEEVAEARDAQLPMNFISVGEVESDDVKVYIKQDVYKALEKLACSDTHKELGSILIGDYSQEYGKTNVVISNYVEAKYTDASSSTLTFTHETWDYIHSEHEKLYPNKRIVGWQHTHPNYGIFLSNYDMFIHENFFNLPFQLAYVIDPLQKLRGFFQWKNGKIEKLGGFYIYDEVNKPIKIEQANIKKAENTAPKRAKLPNVLLVLLCISMVLLSCFTFSLYKKYERQLEAQEEILGKITSQSVEIAAQNDAINSQAAEIAELQKQDEGESYGGGEQISAADLIEKIEAHEILLQNQQESIDELNSFAESMKAEGSQARFIAYTVVAGDSLSKICAAHGIDYRENIKLIMDVNGIENASLIYVGQIIFLPIVD
ncbi:MAG: LysM peptidoglycan-binding domain-containing protein [Clostridia bacterium]|nr:LysM peptidoglycan-binding domain-containing protein [Clostridia bacterium]